jgi:glycosyltransferase involved in cell wall biosynthesis
MTDLSKKFLINISKCDVIGAIGLDLDSYPYSETTITESIGFIFIARMLVEKGIFEYVAVARIVKLNYPNTEFVVLGGFDPDNPAALSRGELDSLVDDGVVVDPWNSV